MAKRGPKSFPHGRSRPLPMRVIAERLGVSVRTVQYDLAHGTAKLRDNPLALFLFETEVR